MNVTRFDVPTIPPGLRREETILQIVLSLEHLQIVAENVFSSISKRLSENRTTLQHVNHRISVAQARVEKLKDAKKATKVFAPCKYPVEEYQHNYTSLFGVGRTHSADRLCPYKVKSKHDAFDERMLQDNLQFFNVQLNVWSKKDKSNMEEGLGRLPSSLPSISSLLLFNTAENPYKKYVMLDPLGVVTKTRQVSLEGSAGPADAPTTIVESEETTKQWQENYFYVPDIGTVPEIAVPDLLPNLIGVADDVSFSAEQGPSIAPSILFTHSLHLPNIDSVPDCSVQKHTTHGIISAAITTELEPPPPPPPLSAYSPPCAAIMRSEVNLGETETSPATSSVEPSLNKRQGGGRNGVSKVVADPGDSRSELMDAIRASGGADKAKLREAKQRKTEGKQSGKAPGQNGGDLMSDLFAKLAMRRKGISGGDSSKNRDGSDSGVDKVFGMITSPPTVETVADEGDDEWD